MFSDNNEFIFNNNRSVTITITNAYFRPKSLNMLLGFDAYKDNSNNWRKLHGLPMKRKAGKVL